MNVNIVATFMRTADMMIFTFMKRSSLTWNVRSAIRKLTRTDTDHLLQNTLSGCRYRRVDMNAHPGFIIGIQLQLLAIIILLASRR